MNKINGSDNYNLENSPLQSYNHKLIKILIVLLFFVYLVLWPIGWVLGEISVILFTTVLFCTNLIGYYLFLREYYKEAVYLIITALVITIEIQLLLSHSPHFILILLIIPIILLITHQPNKIGLLGSLLIIFGSFFLHIFAETHLSGFQLDSGFLEMLSVTIVLFVVLLIVFNSYRALHQTLDELNERDEELMNAHYLAKLSTFKFDFDLEQYEYSDNFFETLNLHLDLDTSNNTFQLGQLMAIISDEDRNKLKSTLRLRGPPNTETNAVNTYKLRNVDGKSRWVRSYLTLGFDGNGKQVKHEGVLQNITDEENYKLDKLRQKNRLIEAERIGNIGHWEWTMETNELYWSDQVYRIFEVPEIGRKIEFEEFKQYVLEEDRQLIDQKIKECIERQTHYHVEHRIVTLNNTVKHLIEDGEVEYHQGKPIKMFGVVKDITDLKQKELELELERSKLLNAMKLAQIGEWEYDSQGVLSLSEMSREILDIDQYELSNMGKMEEKFGKKVMRNYFSSLQDMESGDIIEKVFVRNNLDDKQYFSTIARKEHTGIDNYQLNGVIRDVTIETKYDKFLRDSLKEKDLLLKEIHHRIKNNMQMIQSLIDIEWLKGQSNIDNLIRTTKSRIQTIALVNEKLYSLIIDQEIDMEFFLKDLIKTIVSNYRDDLGNIKLKLDIAYFGIESAHYIPISLILNELVLNTLKHRVDIQNLEVYISACNLNGSNFLTYYDSGETYVVNDNNTNTGFQIIQGLVNQVDGNMTIKYEDHTKITIKF